MNRKSADVCLGVFAKYWQPGEVKTRLGQTLGVEVAATAYRRMLETTLWRLARREVASGAQAVKRILYFTPSERESEFRAWGDRWQLQPQPPGDLGARMAAFFRRYLKDHNKVLVVGSDCPQYPVSQIEQAIVALEQVPMVISPTVDGGYYLLGLRQPAERLFQEMTWSQPTVFEETLRRAEEIKCLYHVLPTLYDLDELADLQRFCREFAQAPDLALVSLASDLTKMLSGHVED